MRKPLLFVLALAACGKSTPTPPPAAPTTVASAPAPDAAVVAPAPDAAVAAPASEADAAVAAPAPAPDAAVVAPAPAADAAVVAPAPEADAGAPEPDAAAPAPASIAQPTIAPEVAARIPPDGLMIATMTLHGTEDGPDFMVIWKLAPSGLTELHRETGVSVSELAWVDAHTLVALERRGDDGSTKVRRFRDGQPDGAPIAVAPADWKDLAPADALQETELMLGPDGAVWLHECAESKMSEDGLSETCLKHALVRVDATPFEVVSKLPKGLTRDGVLAISDQLLDLADLGKVPTPEGFTAKIVNATIGEQKWRALECTAGAQKATWPNADTGDVMFGVKPDKLAWVRTTPPLVAIQGKAVNPVGQESRPTLVFRACSPTPLEAYRTLGDAVWAEHIASTAAGTESAWHLFVDDVLVGVMPGSEYYFAPAPRAP
ncbi:MAG: hypothetical protein U1F43_31885 [Myxococcota bacterium]